ncbi:MAG: biotin--[acetyl-CoA-carboxylase] ligase [Rhodocyclaceae bacterium]|nr:biotin--[acetyl-CoA-carboxylase] ligase [Rhodocyclaceae bacterium]
MDPAAAFPLLRQLADGRFRSGDALATALGVSRSTLCQRLDALAELGIECHRVRGRGCRLPQALDLLDADALAADLQGSGLHIDLVDHSRSTSADLLAQADTLHTGHVRSAEWQTAGRGRQGRRWLAQPAQGLTFSLLWRFDGGVQALAGLSLAVAVAVARACRDCGVDAVRVKWPNDLLLHHSPHPDHDPQAQPHPPDRKLGGVLVDVQGDALGPSVAVIGVGLNVHAAPADAGQPVAALADGATTPLTRHRVLVAALRHLAAAIRSFEANGFAAFRDDWQALHAWHLRTVEVLHADGARTQGVAAGIDADGALLLETPAGRQRILSGDVSLRAR